MAREAYFQQLIEDLTDVLYDDHGIGAKYRMTLVGVPYFEKKYKERINFDTIEETLKEVYLILKEEEIISDAEYTLDGNVLEVTIHSSVHLPMYKNLLPLHKSIFWSPCINVIMYYIDKLIGKESEFLKMDIDGNTCNATIVLMSTTED